MRLCFESFDSNFSSALFLGLEVVTGQNFAGSGRCGPGHCGLGPARGPKGIAQMQRKIPRFLEFYYLFINFFFVLKEGKVFKDLLDFRIKKTVKINFFTYKFRVLLLFFYFFLFFEKKL